MNTDELNSLGYFFNNNRLTLSGHALQLFTQLQQIITNHLSTDSTILYPPLIHEQILESSGYKQNFSQLLISASADNFSKDYYLRPAACLEWYQQFQSMDLDKTQQSLVSSSCSRNENSNTPWRLSTFNMIELVTITDEQQSDTYVTQSHNKLSELFNLLELPVKEELATDAFFMGQDSGSQMIQKLKSLKTEFQYTTADQSFAVASLNNHESFFANKFHITINNKPAFSSCLAIGIERLLLAILIQHKNNAPSLLK